MTVYVMAVLSTSLQKPLDFPVFFFVFGVYGVYGQSCQAILGCVMGVKICWIQIKMGHPLAQHGALLAQFRANGAHPSINFFASSPGS